MTGKMAVPAEKRSSGAVGWAKMAALTEMEISRGGGSIIEKGGCLYWPET